MDSKENSDSLPPEAEVRFVGAEAPASVAASSNGHRSYGDMWKMSRAMSEPGFDLLLFPTVYSFVPVFTRAKKIVMIHDIIAESYPRLTLPKLTSRLFWKMKVALGRRQADAVVTVSDYSRKGIVKRFNLAADQVFVVGEASDPVFRLIDRPELPPRLESLGKKAGERLIIYVGGFSPHKNLELLVEAFAKLASQTAFSDTRLVMVGEYEKEVFHSYFGTVKRMVEDRRVKDRVTFTGYLSDEELCALLNRSTVLALPSLMEGFGLPAVEAAACGCPVIATAASPLPDLLGEAGVYVDPAEPDQLEAALVRVLESEGLRKRMRKAGLEAAGKLTWEQAAREMMATISEVCARR
jgi:glycosyltransferase involved in cell wall biosynthesis